MAVQKGGTRGHNEIQGTEAGDRDMNREAICVSRNAEMKTRTKAVVKTQTRKDMRDISRKDHSALFMAKGEN